MAVWHHACYMHVPHTPDAENMSRTAHTPAETGAVGGVAWMDTRRAPRGAEPKAVNASWRAGGPRPRVQTPGGGELSNSALRYDPHPSTAKRPKVPQELRTPRRARNYAPELQTPVTSVTFERNVAGTMWRPQLCSKGVY